MRATVATYSNQKLEPTWYPHDARSLAVALAPAADGTVEYARGTVMGMQSDTLQYAIYDSTASDGTENAVGLLMYDCSVDTLGNITLTSTPGAAAELGIVSQTTAIWIRGYFQCADLLQDGDTGVLNDAAIEDLEAKFYNGDLAAAGAVVFIAG
jgi:hypothetical protein